MNYKSYFSFGELFKFGPSDEEEEVPLEYRAGVAAALRMKTVDGKFMNQFMSHVENATDGQKRPVSAAESERQRDEA